VRDTFVDDDHGAVLTRHVPHLAERREPDAAEGHPAQEQGRPIN
jgi:hypothetical protein